MRLRFKRVIIDYGHGAVSPTGDQYTFTTPGREFTIHEGTINRKIARILISLLLSQGCVVHDCVAQRVWPHAPRSWKQLELGNVSLRGRIEYANAVKDAIFLSIHSNAMGNAIRGPSDPSRGAVFFVSQNASDASKKVAEIMLTKFREAFEQEPVHVRDGGPRVGNFAVLRDTRMPAVMGEILFFTNIDDATFLMSAHGQKIIAKAYFNGLIESGLRVRKPEYTNAEDALIEAHEIIASMFHRNVDTGLQDVVERSKDFLERSNELVRVARSKTC